MEKLSLKPLEGAEVEAALAGLQGWSGNEQGLKKTIKFGDFRAAMHFMQACSTASSSGIITPSGATSTTQLIFIWIKSQNRPATAAANETGFVFSNHENTSEISQPWSSAPALLKTA